MSTRDFPPLSGHITYDPDTLMRWLNLVGQALNIDDHVEVVSPSASDEVDIFNVASGKRRKLKLSNLPATGGTVTSVSVTTANGVSGSVATATTTPAISLTLGAITPTTIVASGAISGSNLSGTNTGDQPALTLGTPFASTSGTSIDFTGIPAGTKLIKINFDGVSTNNSSPFLIQIGDSGGIEVSGYNGGGYEGAGTIAPYTSGFGLGTLQTAARIYSGSITLTLLSASANTWACSGIISRDVDGATYLTSGSKSLSATLDRVRITTSAGTASFDAGSINIAFG